MGKVFRWNGWAYLIALMTFSMALWHVTLLIRIVASRLTFPMDVEWMEGGALLHAHRFLLGLGVMGPPEQGFVPYPYPPLHYWLLGIFGKIFGLGYTSGRALSIGAFALTCVVLAREVWRHTGTGCKLLNLSGVAVAVGMAVASYPVAGTWFDLIRNDSLSLLFPVLAAGIASEETFTWKRTVALATTLIACLYIKQTGIFFVAWIGLFVLIQNWRRGLWLMAMTGVMSLFLFVIMQITTDGWFLIWISLMRKHTVFWERLRDGDRILFNFAPFMAALPIIAGLLWYKKWFSMRGVLWLGMLVVAFPVALLPYMKLGGFLNNLMPVVVLVGPVTVFLSIDLVNGLKYARFPRTATVAQVILPASAVVFLLLRVYDPTPYMPNAEKKAKTLALNKFIRRLVLDGGVMIPNHPFLAIRNGVLIPQLHSCPHFDAISASIPGCEAEKLIAASHPKWVLFDDEATVLRSGNYVFERYIEPMRPLVGYISNTTKLFRRIEKKDIRLLFDFEKIDYSGWEVSGDAFERGPTIAMNPSQQNIQFLEGERLANSYSTRRLDQAVGHLLSPKFVIDRTHMALLVGGGDSPGTRVSLVVNGREVESARGDRSENLRHIIWDLRPFQGQTARLLILDEDYGSWGHILCDRVELFNAEI